MKEKSDTILYTIKFYSQWHCGSGTSAGANLDALVIKDRNGMPFIPGKTLKGLIKEAAENIAQLEHNTNIIGDAICSAFGTEGNVTGCMHFSNAVLAKKEYDAIVYNNAQHFLYNKITTTSIDDEGIAIDHSLRSMETVVPCTMYAEITDVPEYIRETVVKAMKLIKRLGQKRNRGLGRCDIKEGGIQ